MKKDSVAAAESLTSGDHPFRIAYAATNHVLKYFVAVEPAAALPDLHQPEPDLLGGRLNGDRLRVLPLGFGREFVPWQRLTSLLSRGAPTCAVST
jgi:hypothetical protein